MYHLSDVRSWFHHLCHPQDCGLSSLKRIVLHRRLWGTLAIIALVLVLISFLVLIGQFAPEGSFQYGEMPYRFYPSIP